MKRIFDIVASGIGLILLSPLFIILTIWIKCDSIGPVFYKQVRVGRNNMDFQLFKFRSMCVGSDKKGLITVGGHDPRITRSGYYIRKYKLDEFPQLINVFKGDMSLVGPRPDVPGYADNLQGGDRRMLLLKPGITGPASLKYRNEEELLAGQDNPQKYNDEFLFPDKVRINIEYLDSWSFWNDIKIIIYTVLGKDL